MSTDEDANLNLTIMDGVETYHLIKSYIIIASGLQNLKIM